MVKSYFADRQEKADVRALNSAHKSCKMIWGIANCDNAKRGRLTRHDMACVARHIDKIEKVILNLL